MPPINPASLYRRAVALYNVGFDSQLVAAILDVEINTIHTYIARGRRAGIVTRIRPDRAGEARELIVTCSAPRCRFKSRRVEGRLPRPVDRPCPRCGAAVRIRRGREDSTNPEREDSTNLADYVP